MGIRCADHVTPLDPQKLALTSPTGGGRSVGIVRSRTKATEFFFSMHETFVVASKYEKACRANRDQFHVNIRMTRQRRNNVAVRYEIGEASNILNWYSLRE